LDYKREISYLFIKFIAREIKFGNYNRDDFLENNFDRWREKFYREIEIPIGAKLKKSIFYIANLIKLSKKLLK